MAQEQHRAQQLSLVHICICIGCWCHHHIALNQHVHIITAATIMMTVSSLSTQPYDRCHRHRQHSHIVVTTIVNIVKSLSPPSATCLSCHHHHHRRRHTHLVINIIVTSIAPPSPSLCECMHRGEQAGEGLGQHMVSSDRIIM